MKLHFLTTAKLSSVSKLNIHITFMSSKAAQGEAVVRIGMFGGGGAGKTALCLQFVRGEQTSLYIPTILDEFSKEMIHKKKPLTLKIVDTAGQEDFWELRASFYQGVDGFVLVYSITDRNSLYDAEMLYKDICQNLLKTEVPAILVGNKKDLRDDDSVPLADGLALARKLGCAHIETSALSGENVESAFDAIITLVKKKLWGPEEATCQCAVM
jgi:small GTP-binding protein